MGFLKVLFGAVWVFMRQTVMIVVAPIPSSVRQVFTSFGTAFRSIFQVQQTTKNLVLGSVAGVAILASLVSIGLTQFKRPGKNYLNAYLAVGQVTAEETAKLVGTHSKVVLVAWDTQKYKLPPVETQVKAFKDTLTKQGVTLHATEVIQEDPGSPQARLTTDRFFKILDGYNNVDAIISFVGLPTFKPADLKKWPKKGPKVIAISGAHPGLKKLLEKGYLDVAIVLRPQQPIANPTTMREWFDKYYQVITPKTASSLPG